MIAAATAEDFERTIEAVAARARVDAVIAIFVPPLVSARRGRRRAIRAAARPPSRRRSRCSPSSWPPTRRPTRRQPGRARLRHARGGGAGARPRRALRALGARAAGRAGGAAGDRRATRPPPSSRGALGDGEGWLARGRVRALLAAYGIPLAAARSREPRAGGGARRRRARRPGRAEGDRARAAAQARRRRRAHSGCTAAARSRARGPRDALPAAGPAPAASSCRRWRRPASRCSSASSATRASGRWWPAPRAAPRSSCSATCRSASRRSAPRRRRDAPLAADVPAARRLPRRAARRRGRARGHARARRPRWPPPIPRSPSSTATRWSPAPGGAVGGRRARPRAPAPRRRRSRRSAPNDRRGSCRPPARASGSDGPRVAERQDGGDARGRDAKDVRPAGTCMYTGGARSQACRAQDSSRAATIPALAQRGENSPAVANGDSQSGLRRERWLSARSLAWQRRGARGRGCRTEVDGESSSYRRGSGVGTLPAIGIDQGDQSSRRLGLRAAKMTVSRLGSTDEIAERPIG